MKDLLRAGTLLALCLSSLDGCASAQHEVRTLSSEALFLGTVESLGDTNVMEGDVAEYLPAYRLKSVDGDVIVFAGTPGCGAPADAQQNYLVALIRNRRYGMLGPHATDWLSTVCVAVSESDAYFIRQYAVRGTLR